MRTNAGRTARSRVAVSVAVLALGIGGSTTSASPAAAASGCGTLLAGDVNNDGNAELAVGEPGNRRSAGSVHVLYGRAKGLVADRSGTARNDQYLDQDSAGVPGSSEREDRFGATTVFGDFNADGCADLAVSAPGEDRGAGSVTVLYGSRAGLRTAGAQRVTAPRPSAPLQYFGTRLAVADVDGDGAADLAATGTDVQNAWGKVVVLFGDAKGLDRGSLAAEVVQGQTPGVDVEPVGFASGVAGGDFDGDGRSELAIGQSAADDEGQVAVVTRGPSGYRTTDRLNIHTAGVPSTRQRYEGFGEQLAVGDVDGDERDDLAVGVYEPLCGPECEDAFPSPPRSADGAVAVFRGSVSGLSGQGAQLWTQASPGVVGSSRRDGFGASLAMGRLDAGFTDDVLVGVPFDDVAGRADAGSVTVLLGGPQGLTTAGVGGASFSQRTAGIAGTAEKGDHFGSTLTTVGFRDGLRAEAVVGVVGEDLGKVGGAGQLHQLASAATGPGGVGSRTFNAATAGVQGRADRDDEFAGSLG